MLGLAAAGGVGYYLYSAGGSPKVAEKKLEGASELDDKQRILANHSIADLAKASAKIKGEMPGRGKEAQKTGEAWATEAGAKIDSAVRLLTSSKQCTNCRITMYNVLPSNPSLFSPQLWHGILCTVLLPTHQIDSYS